MANEPNVEVRGAKPNLAKLLKKTPSHPNGRVQLGEDGEIKNPKNNVIKTKKVKIKHESGYVIAEREIPVNGGHVKADGSVWRISLSGPKKYHEKVLSDEERAKLKETADKIAPELEIEEAREYVAYKEFLKEKGVTIAENDEFYAWLKGKKKAS